MNYQINFHRRPSRILRTARALALMVPAAVFLATIRVAPGLAHEDPHDSIEELTLELQRAPGNAELYLKRGELHRIATHWDSALADFEHVTQLDPDHPTIEFHRGRLLSDAAQLQPARESLDRFLSTRPDHSEGLIVRARVLRRLGLPIEAAHDYGRALSLVPTATPVLLLEHAETLAEAGEEHMGAAIGSLDQGITQLGPLIALQSLAIELEVKRGRYDAALGRLDQVLTGAARKERWLAWRGEILEAAGRVDDARTAYAEALAAIEALPSRLRQLPASQELETRVRTWLERERS